MTLKRVTALLAAVLLLIPALLVPAGAAEAYFTDVSKDSWYYGNVRQAYEMGLMVGTDTSTFSPDLSVTRGMFVTVLGRMVDIDIHRYDPDAGFVDVPPDAYYAPYVAWARDLGVVAGVDETRFAPDDSITREQMAAMVYRFVGAAGEELPETASPAAAFRDADQVSQWAVDAVDAMRRTGIIVGDNNGNYLPRDTASRAQVATIFVRLRTALYGGDYVPVNQWLDRVIPTVSDPIVSVEEIEQEAEANGIEWGTPAFDALVAINTSCASRISAAARKGTLLFVFEGAGMDLSPSLRYGAMCVLVRNGDIIHINRYCTTIPDFPFDPARNYGKDMPTLKSGIYSFETLNHTVRPSYCAALNVLKDQVVRFRSRTSFYASTSGNINIHRRLADTITTEKNGPITSSGCIVIGRTGIAASDDYARYAAALGIIKAGAKGNTGYTSKVSGYVIVDRSLGYDYLSAVGYTDGAIKMLG